MEKFPKYTLGSSDYTKIIHNWFFSTTGINIATDFKIVEHRVKNKDEGFKMCDEEWIQIVAPTIFSFFRS